MKRCTECGNTKFERTKHKLSADIPVRHQGRERGITVVGAIPSSRCTNCGTYFDAAEHLEQFERSAAERLLELGIRAGGILRFARKALGIRAADLADLLGVTPETISHWENDKREIDQKALVVVRDLVRDRIEGRTRTHDQLKAFRSAELPTKPLRVDVSRQ